VKETISIAADNFLPLASTGEKQRCSDSPKQTRRECDREKQKKPRLENGESDRVEPVTGDRPTDENAHRDRDDDL